MLDPLSLIDPAHDRRLATAGHEVKYVIANSAAAAVRAWLGTVCRPDPAYRPGHVWTVYFDTPGLALLGEKIDSDYLKTKIRLRWYDAIDGRPSEVFAEVKQRLGNRRDKVRTTVAATGPALARWSLADTRWSGLLTPLRELAPELPSRLMPVLSLCYTRHRFVDPITAARVTVDSAISTTAVNPLLLHGHVPTRVDGAVVEYKGRSADLPQHLRPLVRFGARRQAFSKYLACYQAVTQHAF